MKSLARCTIGLAALLAAVGLGCETETPTTLVVENAFPRAAAGSSGFVAVYKVWFATALFTTPLAPGESSESARGVRGKATAYALLAPGWDPSSTEPPPSLIPVRSASELHATRGDELRIVVADRSFVGSCAAGSTLSQDDADFITQRIFPRDFATVRYDPKTCTTTPIPADGGEDAGADAATD